MKTIGQRQLGKNGITTNFIETLKNNFKNYENIRISVLKSAGHDKSKVKEYSREILEKLGKNYTSKVIGFTIVIKKWRKAVR
jgi:RNA-binding protein YhbY|tara:strand:- start:3259 stop:3504 length:246 start_codon:yes stop_codon:yes gene_type:complete